MKLRYKTQQFQTDAVEAVTGAFTGQPNMGQWTFLHRGANGLTFTGIGNHPFTIGEGRVLENVRRTQAAAGLLPSGSVDMKRMRLTVEMETGTGKTYTYIKTMLELNRLYGWCKFIVVVPGIAIREGVMKSLESTSGHFAGEYGQKISYFAYDSRHLDQLHHFATGAGMQVMIINTQAFAADDRLIKEARDDFGSRTPIDVIAAAQPIVIIDEPQSVLGRDKKNKSREGLEMFKPLFTVMYSATHRKGDIENMVYRLDALDAYNRHLVKKISVKGMEQVGTTATHGFLYLMGIELSQGAPRARLCYDKKTAAGLKQVTETVDEGADLYERSGRLEEYRDGWKVIKIDGYERKITLLNGLELAEGDRLGAVHELQMRRGQIYETIRTHIEKERRLFKRGIKCLSLFFIDHVDNYRKYDSGDSVNGIYADMFEEEYDNVLRALQAELGEEPEYLAYLKRFSAHEVHDGYFARDRKNHLVDTKEGTRAREGDNELRGYQLIMKEKERLLSFDTPVRFLFSHSALKEGWDNPNVFQICTLKDSDNQTKKRQEVGRGMRLCVNSQGERQDESVLGGSVFDVNELTVIASESYSHFAAQLQSEIAYAVAFRPRKVTSDFFIGMELKDADGNVKEADKFTSAKIYSTLGSLNYIDTEEQLTAKYYDDKRAGLLHFGDFDGCKSSIEQKLDTVFNSQDNAPGNARKTRLQRFLPDKFESKEFQALWSKINRRTYYTVDFDPGDLIEKAVKRLNLNLNVTRVKLKTVEATLGNSIESKERLTEGSAMVVEKTTSRIMGETVGSNVKYDLVGKLVEGTGLTRRTVVEILKKVEACTFAQFKVNPEEFILKATNIINECKAIAVVEHIAYHKLDQTFETDIFSAQALKGQLGENAVESKKSLYDLVVVDSKVEKALATAMEADTGVVVYAKLPGGFYINTPVGNYNPDWAIVFRESDGVKHIYFVAETKGGTDLRETENAKIDCARRHFSSIAGESVRYDVVTTFSQLQELIMQ